MIICFPDIVFEKNELICVFNFIDVWAKILDKKNTGCYLNNLNLLAALSS